MHAVTLVQAIFCRYITNGRLVSAIKKEA